MLLTQASFSQNKVSLALSNISVNLDGNQFQGEDQKFPFQYGRSTPDQVVYSKDGTVIIASFKLTSPKTSRSELKNSSVNLNVNYKVEYAGSKRTKSAEHIYYFDANRQFESQETFSFKLNNYSVKVVKFSFKAQIIE